MPDETSQNSRPTPSEDTTETSTGAKSKHDMAQQRITQLLTDAGLPQPDTIEHTTTSVRLLWTDRKVAVIVDLAEPETAAEPQQ